jgi:hypothetical protein
MKVIAALALSATLLAGAGMDEGCSGGEPLPGQDESCEVTARSTNSKGQKYTTVKCSPGGNSSTTLGWWPSCVVGAFWPACKE